ncbi:AAA domain, putative AbiEii toxin, Type IV TA system [compost metagenome]
MLVQFSVQNYRSIKDRCTLSMVASNYYKENELTNTFETGVSDCPRLLKSVVIYGPNAAGKSNLMNAMIFLDSFIRLSAKDSQSGDLIDVTPFMLSSETRESDSEFEVIFIEGGVRYEFGLCINSKRVTEEWLIAYPKGAAQKWFHRIYDATSGEYHYKYSKYFEGGRLRGDWRRQTRENASYLSVAVQFNNVQLSPVYDWFSNRLAMLRPERLSHEFTAKQCANPEFRKKVVEFVRSADIPLADIDVKKRKYTDIEFPDNVPSAVREELEKSLKDKEYFEVFFSREDNEGEIVEFELDDESKGTQGLFNFAGPWIDVTSNDMVLVVDELDSSLHPLIVHHLVEILHRANTKAQIIFTTHDTTILSKKILRRDQVWLIKKNKSQGTVVYPLSDYQVRDGEAIEKGYLSGRYGAIPFVKDLYINGD